MAGMLIQIGQRVMQVDPARAMELVRSGVARMLPPGMQTVGSQAAGQQAAGPFYGGFTTNLPPALQRPGLVGRGAAGAIGAGAMALGGGETPRNPMFDELDSRGTAGAQQPSTLMDQIMQDRSSASSPFGTLSPMAPTSRAPMMMAAPPLSVQSPTPEAAPAVIPRQLFDVLSSYGAGAPMSQPPMRRQVGEMLAGQPEPGYSGAAGQALMDAMATPSATVQPIPPSGISPTAYSGYGGQDSPRERVAMASAPRAPTPLASAAPSVRESFMQRLLSGPNYQSNSMPVVPQAGAQSVRDINWGDPENAADFFRAERALMGLPEETLRVAGLLG
jgi:hypothetical protein